AVVLAGGAEIYLRAFDMFPISKVAWPGRFIPGVGVTFPPRAEVRWTNGVDFWTIQRANSLGFLDREPITPKPSGTFRILLVGDSFIEAAQVPIKQKVQTLLAQKLRSAFPNRSFEVFGLGHSGIGQSHELALFEYFEKAFAPDLVVLVIVSND